MPPFLHPGFALLTVDYWAGLISRFSTCSGEQGYFLICTSKTPVAWIQLLALFGGAIMILFERGRRRALALAVVSMMFILHFYFLLGIDYVLGRLHIIGYHYLYWTLFPLLFGVAVASIATIVRLGFNRRVSAVRWIPAAANSLIAITSLIIFANVISIRLPPVAGASVFGLPPIAHAHVRKGDIHRYLEEHIALAPGKEFRGYVALYLGADDGFVKRLYPSPDGAVTHDLYVAARALLQQQFGNMFQLTDLWNSNIPTLEDYGQWLTKQMFIFNGDLLARPTDRVDGTGVATHLYKFAPELLAVLGVRYIVSDGTLHSPGVTQVMDETSPAGTTLRLYEIKNANLGTFSPTKAVISDSYEDAVAQLEKSPDTVILLGSAALPTDLVPARQARLTVIKGGYHIAAESSAASILVLPVQFSHCWQLVGAPENNASIFRANIVQTGLYFQGAIDATLQFKLSLANSRCRAHDGGDMRKYFSKGRPKTLSSDDYTHRG